MATEPDYYKLATYSDRTLTFVDGKRSFKTEMDAVDHATNVRGPGQYRISKVWHNHRIDLEPFTVPESTQAAKHRRGINPAAHAMFKNQIATRPMSGRPH